jgi:iron-sulfur cluster assembly protein
MNLDDKLLNDFHGNAPIVNESYAGTLPSLTNMAKLFISQSLSENQYFRFGVEGGGCAGFNYYMEIADERNEEDVQFNENPPCLVDSESLQYCWGTILDVEKTPFHSSIKITNPAAKSSCGCGTSFAI